MTEYILLGSEDIGYGKVELNRLEGVISKLSSDAIMNIRVPDLKSNIDDYPTVTDVFEDKVIYSHDEQSRIVTFRKIPSKLKIRITHDKGVLLKFKKKGRFSHLISNNVKIFLGCDCGIEISNDEVYLNFDNEEDFTQWKLSQ